MALLMALLTVGGFCLLIYIFAVHLNESPTKEISQPNDWWTVRRQLDIEEDKNRQIISDREYELGIKREALEQVEHWKHWKELQEKYPDDIQSQYYMSVLPRIYIANPAKYGYFYYIYHDETAKYKGVDRKELVKEEVERLKKELKID
jgi:hypothetical protein